MSHNNLSRLIKKPRKTPRRSPCWVYHTDKKRDGVCVRCKWQKLKTSLVGLEVLANRKRRQEAAVLAQVYAMHDQRIALEQRIRKLTIQSPEQKADQFRQQTRSKMLHDRRRKCEMWQWQWHETPCRGCPACLKWYRGPPNKNWEFGKVLSPNPGHDTYLESPPYGDSSPTCGSTSPDDSSAAPASNPASPYYPSSAADMPDVTDSSTSAGSHGSSSSSSSSSYVTGDVATTEYALIASCLPGFGHAKANAAAAAIVVPAGMPELHI